MHIMDFAGSGGKSSGWCAITEQHYIRLCMIIKAVSVFTLSRRVLNKSQTKCIAVIMIFVLHIHQKWNISLCRESGREELIRLV